MPREARSATRSPGGTLQLMIDHEEAAGNFVRLHRSVTEGRTPIPSRYVGVWAFITNRASGEHLTEQVIADELRIGRDFVRSALHCFERASCLFRSRERDSAGQLRDAVWLITDLPIRLRQSGITDDEEIRAQVATA